MECVYLTKARYKEDYKIFLEFNTGESGEVDLEETIYKYNAAKPIRNKENFARFYLDSWPTLAWECGFDISPESLYSMLGKRAVQPTSAMKAGTTPSWQNSSNPPR